MKNLFEIFKRTKPSTNMPDPVFEDNWRQEHFEKNIKAGVKALMNYRVVNIFDDSRGYELAIEIKRGFILEYMKQISEDIKIEHYGGTITVELKPSNL